MSNILNGAKNLISKCAKNNAMFLFTTAAVGWVLASAAQTIGILTNKKIDKEDKKFLIPQELADGTMNILLYALVTTPLIALTKHAMKNNTMLSPKAKDGAQVIASIAGAIVSSNILTPIARNKLGALAQRKVMHQKITAQDPAYDSRYQPMFQKNYNNIPIKMSNYLAFTKNNGMKI